MSRQNSDIIREHIGKEFLKGKSVPDDETNLIEDEIIDSLGIFMLVAFIEEEFKISVDPEDIVIENFETVSALSRLVDSRLDADKTK